jgi:hypothetical protein
MPLFHFRRRVKSFVDTGWRGYATARGTPIMSSTRETLSAAIAREAQNLIKLYDFSKAARLT